MAMSWGWVALKVPTGEVWLGSLSPEPPWLKEIPLQPDDIGCGMLPSPAVDLDLTAEPSGLMWPAMINAATILFARRRRRSFAVWAVDRV
jgi:hypothetical protein